MVERSRSPLPETQLGPAERLLSLVLNSSAHLWHNRPGVDQGGRCFPATQRNVARGRGSVPPLAEGASGWRPLRAGLSGRG